jgi:hypothetical protein
MGDSGFGSDLRQDMGESQRMAPVEARKSDRKITDVGHFCTRGRRFGAMDPECPAGVILRQAP